MICTSIQGKTLEEILEILESGEVEMAEIRLDLCDLDEEEIEELFTQSDVPLIATCRIASLAQRVAAEGDLLDDAGKVLSEQGLYASQPRKGRNPAEELAENQLLKAIEAGAKYVDLEVEAPPMMGRKIRQACQEYGTMLIRSFHDFEGTPPEATLLSLLDKGRRFGGEVVKIVTTANCKADADRVLALYREAVPGTLVAFCMGPEGRESRLEALKQGAPFTYACLTAEEATAPGQWTAAEMDEAVYGNFRFIGTDETLEMPASKSFAQRAIIAARPGHLAPLRLFPLRRQRIGPRRGPETGRAGGRERLRAGDHRYRRLRELLVHQRDAGGRVGFPHPDDHPGPVGHRRRPGPCHG